MTDVTACLTNAVHMLDSQFLHDLQANKTGDVVSIKSTVAAVVWARQSKAIVMSQALPQRHRKLYCTHLLSLFLIQIVPSVTKITGAATSF